MIFKIKILFVLIGLILVDVVALAADSTKVNYIPEIHGTLRAKYELEPEYMESRFQVRNARLSLTGQLAPIVDYKLEADVCDRGEFKMLEAWGRVEIVDNLKFQAGQMRMPFSVDATRSPHVRFFANRSFIGKQVGNVRGVGAKLAYKIPSQPLRIEAGVFNTATISNHKVWQKKMSYAGKINYKWKNMKFEAGIESLVPDSIRINLLDGSVSWNCDRWFVEGEYIYKHYTNDTFDPCHAYNFMVVYTMPLNKCFFNNISLLGRFDGMTDHSDGYRDENGQLTLSDQARNRVTVGTTVGRKFGKLQTDIRLNYEKYFYESDAIVESGDCDKIVLELVLRF